MQKVITHDTFRTFYSGKDFLVNKKCIILSCDARKERSWKLDKRKQRKVCWTAGWLPAEHINLPLLIFTLEKKLSGHILTTRPRNAAANRTPSDKFLQQNFQITI